MAFWVICVQFADLVECLDDSSLETDFIIHEGISVC